VLALVQSQLHPPISASRAGRQEFDGETQGPDLAPFTRPASADEWRDEHVRLNAVQRVVAGIAI
jgi:hypothetical protein